MDIVEYLLFVPLLIYGIALSDLFGQWKKFLNPKSLYLPHIIIIIATTDIGVNNVFNFFKLSHQFTNITYFTYWLYLLPPLVFLILVNILTNTDDKEDKKIFFNENRKPIFILMAIFMALHFIPQFNYNEPVSIHRLLAIASCLLFAFWNNMLFYYASVLIWLLSLYSRM